ncbi:hypothetical protein ES703_85347 [subsurface metagenome]
MTIDKAIEILTTERERNFNYFNPDRKDALQLGIEAMKHYKEVRPIEVSKYYPLLPGETKE